MTAKTAGALGSLLLIAALVVGCGGRGVNAGSAGIDGSGAPAAPPSPPPRTPIPNPNTVVAYGAVTALGSVWVNGVHYDTSRAVVTIDGRFGTQADLDVGDIVMVVGRLAADGASGVADQVIIRNAVQGPIGAIDAASSSLVVLGQRVRIAADTSFDDSIQPRSIAGLEVGDVVEVAGLRGSEGDIFATRIAVQPLGVREWSTTGFASNVDSVARRFTIHGLVVDYERATIEGFPSGAVANGDSVEVHGSSLGANGALLASRVELEANTVSGNAGDRVEIEGYVTVYNVQTPVSFTLVGVTVTTTPTTVWEGGWFVGARDTKVEVEGILDANGVVVASKVRFVRENPILIGALVDSVSPATSSFVALGITVRTDALTRIEDRSAVRMAPFTLSNLNAGDYVFVGGLELPPASGTVLASQIERRDPQTETELQGYVQHWTIVRSLRQPVPILGVTSTATDTTRYPFLDSELNEATFFFDLIPGSLVHVRGTEVADREIVATEMRFVN